MADEMIPFFFFEGEDGCDECKEMTGHYMEEPERPHPNCDCPIMVDFLEGETEYRNEMKGETDYELEGIDYFYYPNDSDEVQFIGESVDVTLTGDISCEEEIEEACDVSGTYQEEQTFSEFFGEEVEAGGGIIVEAIGEYQHIELGVEVWFVSDEETKDGETVEVFMHMAGDSIEVPVGLHLDVEEIGPPDVVDDDD